MRVDAKPRHPDEAKVGATQQEVSATMTSLWNDEKGLTKAELSLSVVCIRVEHLAQAERKTSQWVRTHRKRFYRPTGGYDVMARGLSVAKSDIFPLQVCLTRVDRPNFVQGG